MTYVDEIVYYESILTKGCVRPTSVDDIVYYKSILTKGTVLEMVTSSAWQAAGCAVRAAHSAYLRRLCSATHRPLLGWP